MRTWVPVVAAIFMLQAADVRAAAIQHLSRTTVPFSYVSPAFTSPVQAVLVTNTGDAPLTITALTLEGPNRETSASRPAARACRPSRSMRRTAVASTSS